MPGLAGALGLAYLSLHLAVTSGMLVWLHQRRPAAFPVVRTALLLASGLALVGFVVFPTAPARLAARVLPRSRIRRRAPFVGCSSTSL